MDVHLNTLTDEQLLRRYSKTLEAGIIDILFERYMHLVYAVSLKYLKHPQIAEDSVMDVFEIVMAKGIKNEIENFKSWLHV
ncbi:MAG: sigma-70 family RNA polymerase sigma factor, partial [Bacteroidales bacterium]|nr:sigma-70 family RNA polymerase sigma factor [Bacteroidales bacterium]